MLSDRPYMHGEYPRGNTPVVIWLVSKMDNSARAKEDRAGWDAQFVRSQTGIGATGASAH